MAEPKKLKAGKVASVMQTAITIGDGKEDGDKAVHSIHPSARVLLDGKDVRLDQLQVGDEIEVFGDPVARIEAKRPAPEAAPAATKPDKPPATPPATPPTPPHTEAPAASEGEQESPPAKHPHHRQSHR